MPGIAVILQARMGSSRLPGKVMKPLCGRPMIDWIIERLKASRKGGPVILATSTSPSEEPLVAEARRLGLEIFRGDEKDVLDRYYRCAKERGIDPVIRATADNPFVDPEECDRLVDLFREAGVDYACAFPTFGSGLPDGVGLEIFSFAALEKCWKEGKAPHHREHVNEYVYDSPKLFKTAVLRAPPEKRAELSLTVDTPEDFAKAERLYSEYFRSHPRGIVPVAWAVKA